MGKRGGEMDERGEHVTNFLNVEQFYNLGVGGGKDKKSIPVLDKRGMSRENLYRSLFFIPFSHSLTHFFLISPECFFPQPYLSMIFILYLLSILLFPGRGGGDPKPSPIPFSDVLPVVFLILVSEISVCCPSVKFTHVWQLLHVHLLFFDLQHSYSQVGILKV